MITTEEADAIKEILGSNYAKKIVDHLKEKKVLRESGKNYSRWDVYQVMCSVRENEEMTSAIIDLVDKTKQRRQEELAKRQAILK